LQEERSLLVVEDKFAVVSAPITGVHRVGRGSNAFEPPSWGYCGEDGTFGNRFDDPRGREDPVSTLPTLAPQERFKVVYCATDKSGAFGETLARFRPDWSLLAKARDIDDDEPFDDSMFRGMIPKDWRMKRRIGHANISADLRFVDVEDVTTLRTLRNALGWRFHANVRESEESIPLPDQPSCSCSIMASLASMHVSSGLDRSHITSSCRCITQEIARYVYEQKDELGNPMFSGIRYMSKLNASWELWAMFDDRVDFSGQFSRTIFPDDVDLITVCNQFDLDPPDSF
jgi:hypothetical protein